MARKPVGDFCLASRKLKENTIQRMCRTAHYKDFILCLKDDDDDDDLKRKEFSSC